MHVHMHEKVTHTHTHTLARDLKSVGTVYSIYGAVEGNYTLALILVYFARDSLPAKFFVNVLANFFHLAKWTFRPFLPLLVGLSMQHVFLPVHSEACCLAVLLYRVSFPAESKKVFPSFGWWRLHVAEESGMLESASVKQLNAPVTTPWRYWTLDLPETTPVDYELIRNCLCTCMFFSRRKFPANFCLYLDLDTRTPTPVVLANSLYQSARQRYKEAVYKVP